MAKGHHPRWAAEALWSAALKKGDTPGLYNASKLLLQADPKSVVARTHFIFLALITQQDEAAVHPLAESLYKENPAVADSALAFAFSLFRQNRPEEAVTVFSKLPPEKLAEPRLAFYQGLFLTVAGRPDEAEKSLQLAAETPLLPEMEALRRILMPAFEAKRFDRDGKRVECDRAWDAAIAAAGTRPDWLEILARVAIAWNWESKAGVVLNKLATAGRCPAWAIPTLWAVSLKSGDSAEIYQAAKLVLAANPKDFAARNNFIAVALLTGKSADSPHQLAEALHAENPANPDAAATHCLSLYRQGKLESALAVLRQLKPEQLQQPRPARYHGLVLAALGQPEEAAPALSAGATGPMLPEEKALVETLEMAFQWRAVQQGADLPAADAAWKKALSAAQRRPEMLETLGRMLLKWEASEKASEVMWKLTGTPQCPRWVIDQLWADAEKQRNTTQLYQLSRLLRRASPEDVTCRSNFVRFSLLTGQDADFPHRLADALLDENPGNPEVAATSALSLLQRKKAKEAVAVFAALKPEQLKNPRVAYYYGLALTASGQAEKARTYLEKGSEKPLLPEEERLLAEVNSTSAAHLGR